MHCAEILGVEADESHQDDAHGKACGNAEKRSPKKGILEGKLSQHPDADANGEGNAADGDWE